MNTVSLDPGQRERARTILARLKRGEIEQPLDVLESWGSVYDVLNYHEIVAEEKFELTRDRRYVSVDEIAGTTHENPTDPNKFQPRRLENALRRLLGGDFEREHQFPPFLDKIDGTYYVSTDGNHRTIAFKALGIEEMYARVGDITILE